MQNADWYATCNDLRCAVHFWQRWAWALLVGFVICLCIIGTEGWRTGWRIKQANERADTACALLTAHTNRPPIPWMVCLTLDEARAMGGAK